MVVFNDLLGIDKVEILEIMVKDFLNDLIIVGSVVDFIVGIYSFEMIQDICYNCQGVILIVKDGKGEDLKV